MRLKTLLLATLILNTPMVWADGPLYCCIDANGHRVCGNPLPQQCYSRAYKEISSSGRIREVEAPLTNEERARKDAAERQRQEEEMRVAERRRRDRVLLESYTNVGEIERRRDSVVGGAEREIETLRRREKELADERLQIQQKIAAMKGKKGLLARAQEDLAANASEVDTLNRVILQKQREAETIRARFEEDRVRYLELTTGNSAPAASK